MNWPVCRYSLFLTTITSFHISCDIPLLKKGKIHMSIFCHFYRERCAKRMQKNAVAFLDGLFHISWEIPLLKRLEQLSTTSTSTAPFCRRFFARKPLFLTDIAHHTRKLGMRPLFVAHDPYVDWRFLSKMKSFHLQECSEKSTELYWTSKKWRNTLGQAYIENSVFHANFVFPGARIYMLCMLQRALKEHIIQP